VEGMGGVAGTGAVGSFSFGGVEPAKKKPRAGGGDADMKPRHLGFMQCNCGHNTGMVRWPLDKVSTRSSLCCTLNVAAEHFQPSITNCWNQLGINSIDEFKNVHI
jgi:hypothetical protein